MTSGTTMATSQRNATPRADVDDINVDVEQSASAGKPAKKRTNPLATISNLRHILSVHKAAGAVGGPWAGLSTPPAPPRARRRCSRAARC